MKNTQVAEYTVPQGVRATKTQLIIPPGLAKEEWANLWQYLSTASDSVNLWKADALTYGQNNYEAEFISSVVGQQELAIHGMESLVLLQQVDPAYRNEVLTEAHYLVAAKRCKDKKDQEVWLDTAVIEGLDPKELQASIRKGEVVRIDMKKRRVSLPSPYAALREYKAWQREWGQGYKQCNAQELEEILQVIRPMFDYYCEVAAYRQKLLTERSEAVDAK